MNRQIILDTETTGLYASHGDRLIEFAGLEMIDRRLTGQYLHVYIHPERDIPEAAIAVHGITLEKLADKPKFAAVGQQIFDFLKGAELIIHNAPFDLSFLNMEFAHINLPKVESVTQITDTLAMAREKYPGQKNSLDALCTRLDIDRSKRVMHGALIDCELLADVYLAMTRSQFSLDMDGQNETIIAENKQQNDYSHQKIKVIYPTDGELLAHQDYVTALDKSCGGQSLYRQFENQHES